MDGQKFSLTGNQLKLIALAAMTLDHVGKFILPDLMILQILGRLAFPIFAYMIAEGCRYTKERRKYLLSVAGVAALCQAVYFIFMDSLYMSIMVTFSLSICLIYVTEAARACESVPLRILSLLCYLLVALLCLVLPGLLIELDFGIDYGLFGVLMPVVVYFAKTKNQKLLITCLALCLVALDVGGIQWFGLLAVLLLAFYGGKRGKVKLKNVFYIYYPTHLAVIYGIGLLIRTI